MKWLPLLAMFPLAFTSLSAKAAGENYFYAGMGSIGYEMPGTGDNRVYEDPSLTVGVGQYLSNYFAYEGFYRYSDNSDANLATEIDAHQAGFSIILTSGNIGTLPLELFIRGTGTFTYLKARSIYNSDHVITEDDSVFGVNLGGGLQWNIGDNFWLRTEYIHNMLSTDINVMTDPDYEGLQLTIGRRF